jgi:hypothetical protein
LLRGVIEDILGNKNAWKVSGPRPRVYKRPIEIHCPIIDGEQKTVQ